MGGVPGEAPTCAAPAESEGGSHAPKNLWNCPEAARKVKPDRMKRLKILALLAGGHVLVGVAIVTLCWWHVHLARESGRQTQEMMIADRNRQAMQLLLNQSGEYARGNPAFMAELNKLGIKVTENKPAR